MYNAIMWRAITRKGMVTIVFRIEKYQSVYYVCTADNDNLFFIIKPSYVLHRNNTKPIVSSELFDSMLTVEIIQCTSSVQFENKKFYSKIDDEKEFSHVNELTVHYEPEITKSKLKKQTSILSFRKITCNHLCVYLIYYVL